MSQHIPSETEIRDGRIQALQSRDDEINRLRALNAELLAALLLLTGNPHVSLEDLVYQVREREGEGWDGPAVLAWSQAVEAAKAAITRATES